jgi:hypothetical protein
MNFAKSRQIDFQMPDLPGSMNLGHGNAAGLGGYAGMYGANMKTTPDWGQLGATNVAARSNERAAVTKAEADVHAMGLQSVATVRAAEIQAEAAKEAAQAQAQGSMMGSAFGAIGSIGGALIGLSDATTKENVATIDDGLSVIKRLKPKTYNYKPEWQGYSNRKHSGFIAQEYQQVIPEGTYNDEESGKLCVDLAEVIAPLVSAVQQLEARITELEKK